MHTSGTIWAMEPAIAWGGLGRWKITVSHSVGDQGQAAPIVVSTSP